MCILPISATAVAQTPAAAPAPPPFATTKLTDNVYYFRHGGYQAMFVVTPQGVIATDPIGYANAQAPQIYLDEIRKVTSAPIRYVVYSHHHYDHIMGGKPFKDAGATFVAHRNAKTHLAALDNPNVVMPDETVDDRRTIELGGVRVDLIHVGRNHSDNSLAMLVPRTRCSSPSISFPCRRCSSATCPTAFCPIGSTRSIACSRSTGIG
jgi:glyoxylase-like metal-dependent hydrolase (beta-lactamase superfamily II)